MFDHTGYICVNDDERVNIKSAAKHRLYLKRIVWPTVDLYFEMD